MKRTYLYMLFALLAAAFVAPLQAKRVRTVRLTSYNIQHGEGLDKKIDHDRQARILRKAHADVAAIQEVDSVTKRNGGLYSLEEIGRKAKMHATFAPAIKFQGGKYGIGILSKKRPLSVHRIPLPGREESRMLLVAEFKHYVVACTHLSLTDEDRLASVPIIVAEASKWQLRASKERRGAKASSKPFFLMGDLNDEPGMPFYKEMQKHFLFLNPSYDKTFPADKPNICIDHVAMFKPTASPEATLSFYNTWVGEEDYSDHRPLHAKIGIFK